MHTNHEGKTKTQPTVYSNLPSIVLLHWQLQSGHCLEYVRKIEPVLVKREKNGIYWPYLVNDSS
jgi:hypothetical protein